MSKEVGLRHMEQQTVVTVIFYPSAHIINKQDHNLDTLFSRQHVTSHSNFSTYSFHKYI
jgi:hypothetical protein